MRVMSCDKRLYDYQDYVDPVAGMESLEGNT